MADGPATFGPTVVTMGPAASCPPERCGGSRSCRLTTAPIHCREENRHEPAPERRSNVSAPAFLDVLEELIKTVVEPSAADVDANGTFPRAAVSALAEADLLGL